MRNQNENLNSRKLLLDFLSNGSEYIPFSNYQLKQIKSTKNLSKNPNIQNMNSTEKQQLQQNLNTESSQQSNYFNPNQQQSSQQNQQSNFFYVNHNIDNLLSPQSQYQSQLQSSYGNTQFRFDHNELQITNEIEKLKNATNSQFFSQKQLPKFNSDDQSQKMYSTNQQFYPYFQERDKLGYIIKKKELTENTPLHKNDLNENNSTINFLERSKQLSELKKQKDKIFLQKLQQNKDQIFQKTKQKFDNQQSPRDQFDYKEVKQSLNEKYIKPSKKQQGILPNNIFNQDQQIQLPEYNNYHKVEITNPKIPGGNKRIVAIDSTEHFTRYKDKNYQDDLEKSQKQQEEQQLKFMKYQQQQKKLLKKNTLKLRTSQQFRSYNQSHTDISNTQSLQNTEQDKNQFQQQQIIRDQSCQQINQNSQNQKFRKSFFEKQSHHYDQESQKSQQTLKNNTETNRHSQTQFNFKRYKLVKNNMEKMLDNVGKQQEKKKIEGNKIHNNNMLRENTKKPPPIGMYNPSYSIMDKHIQGVQFQKQTNRKGIYNKNDNEQLEEELYHQYLQYLQQQEKQNKHIQSLEQCQNNESQFYNQQNQKMSIQNIEVSPEKTSYNNFNNNNNNNNPNTNSITNINNKLEQLGVKLQKNNRYKNNNSHHLYESGYDHYDENYLNVQSAQNQFPQQKSQSIFDNNLNNNSQMTGTNNKFYSTQFYHDGQLKPVSKIIQNKFQIRHASIQLQQKQSEKLQQKEQKNKNTSVQQHQNFEKYYNRILKDIKNDVDNEIQRSNGVQLKPGNDALRLKSILDEDDISIMTKQLNVRVKQHKEKNKQLKGLKMYQSQY